MGRILTLRLITSSPASPFDPAKEKTRIIYSAHDHGEVEVYVCDLSGRLVWQEKKHVAKGNNFSEWDGRNVSGAGVGSGVYFCRIVVRAQNGSVQVYNHKIVVVRR